MKRRNFKNSMVEYCKTILEKTSFSRRLFRKEYRKTFSYLPPDEHKELKKWLKKRLKKDVLRPTG